MLGRFINFLLVIPHTYYLNNVSTFGAISAIFAFIAFFNVILNYGMETSYFNSIRSGRQPNEVFAVAQKSIITSTLLFALIVLAFPKACASGLKFPGHTDYIYCCLAFLVFDALSMIPFARLRYEEKSWRFALIKLTNILVNVFLNLYFLSNTPHFLIGYDQVTLVLLANAIASLVSFILLSPQAFNIAYGFDRALFKTMLNYAWPLIFVGLAGIVNETLDRALLDKLLPKEEGLYQNGIYGAFYKLTMIMTMFVQAFRFAAMPFFFKQKESAENRQIYATVMYWFIGVCSFIFLACILFVEPLAHLFIRKKEFFENPYGLYIVPILLMANLFLGVYYNLSIWYQLTNNTRIGAIISTCGALLTIALNVWLIPHYGFLACAWITFIVYFLMCVASYLLGHHYYKVPYTIGKYAVLILFPLFLWKLAGMLEIHSRGLAIILNAGLLAVLLLIIWLLQPKPKNT